MRRDYLRPLNRDRFERRRSCGSSWRLCHSRELVDLLDTHNSTPKTSKAVFMLLGNELEGRSANDQTYLDVAVTFGEVNYDAAFTTLH